MVEKSVKKRLKELILNSFIYRCMFRDLKWFWATLAITKTSVSKGKEGVIERELSIVQSCER
jgi:hypothetical protein